MFYAFVFCEIKCNFLNIKVRVQKLSNKFYFPTQKVEVVDNKNLTKARFKYGPNIW